MFSFFTTCCSGQPLQETIGPQPKIMYQYYIVDQTKQKITKMVSITNPAVPQQLQGWKRTRIITQNMEAIKGIMRQRMMSNYVDDEFPHSVASLGQNIQIQWIRIGLLVNNPIYISQKTIKQWNHFRCSNKTLQSALYLMRKHNPQEFRQLISKNISNQGIYQYRVMISGQIRDLLIDDYVPSLKGMPIYARAFNVNQVFPLLIQKVTAKAFGSYQRIPETPFAIVELLACTPVLCWQLSKQVTKQALLAIKNRIDVKASTTCFVPRRMPQSLDHGLLEDQFYVVTAIHQVLYNGKTIVLYEMLNLENKGDWNGPFSEFDVNWQHVPEAHQKQLKQRMNEYDTIMIEETDIPKYFSVMGSVLKGQGKCLDCVNLQISRKNAAYLTIVVTSPSNRVILKLFANEQVRQVMVLARILPNNVYEFVCGNMIQQSNNNFLRADLTVGVYCLFLKVQWKQKQVGLINLSIMSTDVVNLEAATKNQYPEFIPRLFSYMVNGPLKLRPQIEKKQYSVYFVYRKTGYIFLMIKPLPDRPVTNVIINDKLLLQNGFKVRKPNRGRGQFQINGPGSYLVTIKVVGKPTNSFPEGCLQIS